jgi:putative hydrolase of HD superfamily
VSDAAEREASEGDGPAPYRNLDAQRLAGLKQLLALKTTKRTGWLRAGVDPQNCESVADHAFYVVLFAALFADDSLDRATVLEMAIVHDLAETVVGDLTPSDCPRPEKIERERAAMVALCRSLPNGQRWLELWETYERQESPEAKFVRAIDRTEMAWQAALYAQEAGIDAQSFQTSAERDADATTFMRLNDAIARVCRDFPGSAAENP